MRGLKEALKGVIPESLLAYVPSSFDVVGSRSGAVAIVEIPEEVEAYKYEIARAIVRLSRNVKTVLRRVGPRTGDYRLYSFETLLGKDTEVIHVESGVRIMLDPVKVFFSPRDQGDRLEVASMVNEGEVIAYLFAGVAPYAFVILKHKPGVRLIYAVEINPEAVKYAEINVRLNKARGKVIPLEMDAASFCIKMPNTFDRILMTLPLGAHKYLDQALRCVKNGGIINFYHTGPEENPFSEGESIIQSHCRDLNMDCIVIGRSIVRDYAPRVYKIRLDFKVHKGD